VLLLPGKQFEIKVKTMKTCENKYFKKLIFLYASREKYHGIIVTK